ncbi:MAG: ABC transporter ATP-binding protein [Geminicoccaceae bacterium]|nr:ABC transporter ATP-binding protein [Geminicoccaceae bacterium]
MEPTIFGFLRRYAWKQQAVILALTALTLPLGYAALELPKLIINRALGEDVAPQFLGRTWDQLHLLWTLCGLFLLVVLVSGGLKYVVNVYAGVVSERMLRRLRYQLFDHVLRFPLPHLKRMSQGELVQMINAEVEPLGGFVGEAVTTPGLQGGTLLISLTFMFVQDPILGLAAIALYPLQVWLIPKLQAQVNRLGKERVRQVRRNAEKISEAAGGVRDIRGNDATLYEQTRFSSELAQVFNIRFDIYKKKFLIKFINNFMAQLGPFFFYAIGGYLVIQGDLTVGALVAVIGAQKDIASPWKELLSFYQTLYDVRIKYDQVIAQFVPAGLRDQKLVAADPPEDAPAFRQDLRVSHLTLSDEEGNAVLDGVAFDLPLPTHLAIAGRSGSGKADLVMCLAGLVSPSAGRVSYDGIDLESLPDSVKGRKIAFVGNPAQIFSGSIADNLLYGLRRRPLAPAADEAAREAYLEEAERAGNAPFYPDDEWTDYASAGLDDDEARLSVLIELLTLVHLDQDAYLLGLRGSLRAEGDEALQEALLEARRAMQERLAADARSSRLVEAFHPDRYNENATIAENLIFGTPIDDTFDVDRLADHAHVRGILDEVGLTRELIEVGYRLAATMLELFADLPPDHEYFRQFSFIEPEELPDYKSLLGRTDIAHLDEIDAADRNRLLSLPFKLIPARHRLDLVSRDLQERILEARRLFRERLPEELEDSIAFFDPGTYNRAAAVQDNILFGKITYGQAQAAEKIAALITEILEKQGLREGVVEVGLRAQCGLAGGRLSAAQRQKLALARALVKQPEVLILDDALAPLDRHEAKAILEAVLQRFADRTVIWTSQDHSVVRHFAHVVVLDRGQVIEKGEVEKLDGEGSALRRLVGTTS